MTYQTHDAQRSRVSLCAFSKFLCSMKFCMYHLWLSCIWLTRALSLFIWSMYRRGWSVTNRRTRGWGRQTFTLRWNRNWVRDSGKYLVNLEQKSFVKSPSLKGVSGPQNEWGSNPNPLMSWTLRSRERERKSDGLHGCSLNTTQCREFIEHDLLS